jgi:hypothetical protein
VRRFSAVVLTLALVASVLAMASSSASAEPYGGPEEGVLKATPSTFTAGQPIELMANFPSDQASEEITFLEESSAGDFTTIGTDAANSLGNAYFEPVTVDAKQDFFARTPDGKVTQLLTLEPTVVKPENYAVGGTLTMNPATAHDGDVVYFLANFPSGTFDVTLYEETSSGVWSALGVDRTNTSGNAYFHDFEVTGTRNVFAVATTGKRTEVDTITPTPEVTLSIQRDCTGNDCSATTATASGGIDPAQEGRSFELQYASGSSWIGVGDPDTTGADGKVEIQFSLTGVPQWSSRQYRLHSAAGSFGPAVSSNVIRFMPGPTQLGKNVLRIDVEDGVFPATKGPEYPARATLSTDGEVFLEDEKIEEFGVRGFSTAGYPKKPFKLKFEDSPKETGVFGMEADKSWTLLAMWLDRSFVRDKVGLELGRAMNNGWTPDSRYVELFVNDRYEGAYLMTESVKIDGDRVDLDKEQGMIVETDGKTVVDSRLGFKSSKGIVWAAKDPDKYEPGDPEQVNSTKLSRIKGRINNFESKLYSSSTREEYTKFLDVDKALDFYFIREFTKERDGDMYRSNYVSWDPSGNESLSDGKLHFGPAWDFDRSAGISGEGDAVHRYVDDPEGFYLRGTGTHSEHPTYRTHWFVQLFKSASFRSASAAQWDAKRSVFESASQIARDADAALGPGAENDQGRWPQTRRYEDHGSHQDEVDYVAEWYDARFEWLDDNL